MKRIQTILPSTQSKNFSFVLHSLLVFFCLQDVSARPAAPARPSAELLIESAVERAEGQRLAGLEVQFESWISSVVESRDSDGSVTDSETQLLKQYPIRGALYEELVEKQGRPLSDQETREEQKKVQKFTRQVNRRLAKGESPQPEADTQVLFDQEFVSRYQFELAGEDSVGRYSCWVVSFSPREGKLPVRRRMDEALNNSQGRIWIEKDGHGIVQVEFSLIKPIRYLWGLLATIRDTKGKIRFEQVESDIWMPSNFELTLDLRILVKSIRRRIKREWTEYRRINLPETDPALEQVQPTR